MSSAGEAITSKRSRRSLFMAERRYRGASSPPRPTLEPDPDAPEMNACVNGTDIVVTHWADASRLHTMGNFGTFVGQRMNFANWQCFVPANSKKLQDETAPSIGAENEVEAVQTPTEAAEQKLTAKRDADEWTRQTTGGGGLLHLSPEEALYLSHDLGVLTLLKKKNDESNKDEGEAMTTMDPSEFFALQCSLQDSNFSAFVHRYLVYRFFRRLGWVVRDGISFGVDFLLYKCSVDVYHSSAGVRVLHHNNNGVSGALTDPHIGALQRELANCKKRLLLARVIGLPADVQRLQAIDAAQVQVLSMTGWNANRSRILDLGTNKTTCD